MEHLSFARDGDPVEVHAAVVVGVVSSGNLEVLIESLPDDAACRVDIVTPARGFDDVWAAVVDDFFDRARIGGVRISINDVGATPAVVSLRLDQAIAEFRRGAGPAAAGGAAASAAAGAAPAALRACHRRPVMTHSFYEANARQRVTALLDAGSFRELLPPSARATSPHLPLLDTPVAFDDGVVVGSGLLDGHAVLVASQEGAFMGGAVGEVHGAKLTGLFERAIDRRPTAVLLLLESGGVRLHEANAGLIAVSETMRALLDARAAGIPVVGLIGSSVGCFGGMGLIAACCDTLVMSEEGRLGMSGPEVIETKHGVEEFDSRDRALVWRTTGGKHRWLLGDAQAIVDDDVASFRAAAIGALGDRRPLTLDGLLAEQAALTARLERFGTLRDALDVWAALGIAEPAALSLLDRDAFVRVAGAHRFGGDR